MRRAARFIPALLWASLIFLLSSQPRLPDLPLTFDGVDKAAHALFFGILCAWVVFGFGHRGRPALVAGIVATSLYGGFDEVHQMFVPGRSPDILDWVADTAGAALAATAIRFWRLR
ncbi:MAG: VanZ family protein [Myxococcota bacterium]